MDGTGSTLLDNPPPARSKADIQRDGGHASDPPTYVIVPHQAGDTTARTREMPEPTAATEESSQQPPQETLHSVQLARPSTEVITVRIPLVIEIDSPDLPDTEQQIFSKINLSVERSRYQKLAYERVNKAPRMRVRYTCHQCRTSFGYDRVCFGCRHRRCTKCDRYPPKKTRPDRAERPAAEDDDTHTASVEETAQPEDAAAKDLYCNCHECQTGIDVGIEECPNCHHAICERCIEEYAVIQQSRHESLQQQQQAESIQKEAEQLAEQRPADDGRTADEQKPPSTTRPPD